MRMIDVAMVAADTSRSRVYMQALIRNHLMPSFVLILGNNTSTVLPGQINSSDFDNNNQDVEISHDCWSVDWRISRC